MFEDGADVDPACLTLRDLVDLALAECCPDAYAGGDAAKSDGRVEDGGSDGADAKPSPDADPSPGADGAAARRDGYAWLNVNRTPHSNFLHTHTFERWSGCYFVQEGEPNAPGFACPTSGHMVFRGGRRRRGHEADGGPAEGASHTYFAVPPTPGTLWLFGGTVPHCVMRTQLPPGVPEPESPRISIGVNWSDAVTPSPRPPLA